MEGGVRHACVILLLHVKQNKTKLSKNCHPHTWYLVRNTSYVRTIVGSGYISYERLFDEWWDEQNRCTRYVRIWGTPCKCCSRSQQRSSPGLRLRWTPKSVSTTDGWLTLNFASCVIRRTRSLGVLVLCSIWNMLFVNYVYDMVVDTQLHMF